MNHRKLYKALTVLISLVWIINGLVCKVLFMVPRHSEIVAVILGNAYAMLITQAIGFAEIGLGIWILTRFLSRLSALLQMALVATMNIMEFVLARDLLLWGPLNALFAAIFITLISWHEFKLKPIAENGISE